MSLGEDDMTWLEMKRRFPNEWLLIFDYVLDDFGRLVEGWVMRHDRDKEVVYRLPGFNRPTAFRYTGESTFGLTKYVEDDCSL